MDARRQAVTQAKAAAEQAAADYNKHAATRAAEEEAAKALQIKRDPIEKAADIEAKRIAKAQADAEAAELRMQRATARNTLTRLLRQAEAREAEEKAREAREAKKMASSKLKEVVRHAGSAEAAGAGDKQSKEWIAADATRTANINAKYAKK